MATELRSSSLGWLGCLLGRHPRPRGRLEQGTVVPICPRCGRFVALGTIGLDGVWRGGEKAVVTLDDPAVAALLRERPLFLLRVCAGRESLSVLVESPTYGREEVSLPCGS